MNRELFSSISAALRDPSVLPDFNFDMKDVKSCIIGFYNLHFLGKKIKDYNDPAIDWLLHCWGSDENRRYCVCGSYRTSREDAANRIQHILNETNT
jgi:hypothetical protein